jgi:HAD superfamily hydrolase (TIGR01459 family)
MVEPPSIASVDALVDSYNGFLIDAYGVLVDKRTAMPGAAEFLARLDDVGRPWLVVTNSASRLPETLSGELLALGLEVAPQRFLTSGELLAEHFVQEGLVGHRCIVLGTDESRVYTERAGGLVVELDEETDADVLIVADQKGVHCLEDMNRAMSLMLRRLDKQQPLHLLLCNPDLIYPVAPGRFGFTAGGLAAMLEAVLRERYPSRAEGFLRLGKPHRPIFDAACRRLGVDRPLMIGDQIATDILGASRYGIDTVLVGTGLSPGSGGATWPVRPTWFLPSLEYVD